MKKTFPILLSSLILFSLINSTVHSQKFGRNKNSKKSVKVTKIKKSKILSLGVINSKALNLVQPKFPATASYLGVHGTVRVSIIVDENGDVIEAKALSGNLFLIPNSLIAAKESKFKPFKSGDGNAIKVSGLIYYNFHPRKLNWFELGFYSDQLEKLDEFLPIDFAAERQLIVQYENAEIYSKKQIYESIIASIENKISVDEKNFWLFKIGIALRKLNRNFRINSDIEKSENELENLILASPQNLSSKIKARLEKILEFSRQNNDSNFNSAKQNLIDNSFMFGN